MDFLTGTSRFYDIVNHFWYEESLPGQAIGGAKIPTLIQEALSILTITGYEKRRDSIFYIGGGLPDITKKLKSARYQEVIHDGEPLKIANEVMCQIEDGARQIYNAGAVPVFSTVSPMNIPKWNFSRLQKGKTSYLAHENMYTEMQLKHEDTVKILNSYIIRLNNYYHMQTPRLARVVFQKKGKNQDYRLRENRFHDGVHPTEETTDEWIKIMRETMDTNRLRFAESYSEPQANAPRDNATSGSKDTNVDPECDNDPDTDTDTDTDSSKFSALERFYLEGVIDLNVRRELDTMKANGIPFVKEFYH